MAIKENALPVSQSIGSGDYLRKVSSGGVSQQVPFSEVKDAVVTVDPAIDSESENPVQNKAIAAALDAAGTQTKQDIAAAIQTEVTNRNSAISQAISTEVSNRNQAIASAIQTETADRNAAIEEAIADEVTDRNAAIASAIESEETARNTAISEAVAAEAQAREAADEELNQSKANTDGNYPDMTVGNADQLISSIYTEDQTPYNFRQSGGGLSIGDREIDKIVGGTVAWNQLFGELGWDYWTKPAQTNLSVSNGIATMTLNTAPTKTYDTAILYKRFKAIANHKYLVSVVAKVPRDGTFTCDSNTVFGANKNFTLSANVWSNVAFIGTCTTDLEGDVYFFPNAIAGSYVNGDSWQMKEAVVFDLTQMFGSTIADYIYSLEQANAGAGVAWFKKLFPKPYYEYNAGELISVSGLESHDTVGFNAYNPATGTAEVLGGNQYQITGTYTSISLDGTAITPDSNGLFTPTANGTLAVTGGNDSDTCVHLVWSGYRNGEYEPYEKHSYPLDNSLTLRGIPKLDNGNLYYDGDEYASDGSVTRKYGIVDLGTLNWTYFASETAFSCILAGMNRINGNLLCDGYTLNRRSISSISNMEFTNQSGSIDTLWFKNTAYTDSTSFKTAMSGVYLVYELATPTTETAAPYTNPQTVSDWGTEEYVDAAVQEGDRDVAVPVGHVTDYLANLRDKLQNLPDAANADGTYLIQQTSGQMALLAYTPGANIPAAPTTDGTYTLQAVVSGGVATYSWVSN